MKNAALLVAFFSGALSGVSIASITSHIEPSDEPKLSETHKKRLIHGTRFLPYSAVEPGPQIRVQE